MVSSVKGYGQSKDGKGNDMKYKRVYEGGELSAYVCEKGRIEIEYGWFNRNGNCEKWYKANGWAFHTLREAKAELEKLYIISMLQLMVKLLLKELHMYQLMKQ